jgi:hypothetical protein
VEVPLAEDHARDLDAANLALEQAVHIDVEPGILPAAPVIFDLQRREHPIDQPIELVDEPVRHKLQNDLSLLKARKPDPHRNRLEDRQRGGDVDLDFLAIGLHTHHLLRQARIRGENTNQLVARQNNLPHTYPLLSSFPGHHNNLRSAKKQSGRRFARAGRDPASFGSFRLEFSRRAGRERACSAVS